MENAHGMFDVDANLRLWTRSGLFNIGLNKTINLDRLSQMIAFAIL